jgi:ubiquinone biosynthesis protein COQ4
MRIDPQLRHRAIRAAVGLLETARDPEHTLVHALPMLDVISDSTLGEAGRARLLEDPILLAMARERYRGTWPDADALAAMPAGSLGRLHQERFERLGLQPTPAPQLPSLEGDGAYLLQRLRSTHDLHHTVLGLPITVAGEAAGSTYYAQALHQPGSVAILAAWILHGQQQSAEHDAIWAGIRYGLEVAETVGPRLLSTRWEEGWEEPIAIWRERLGLTDLLPRSPFQEELALLS